MIQKDRLSKSLKRLALLLFLIITGIATQVKGQLTMKFYSANSHAAVINNYEEAQAGLTINSYLTLQYDIAGSNYAPGWTVKVRANGNFTNGVHSIPSQYVSLKFRNSLQGPAGVTGNEVPLTSTDANLINTAQPLNTPPTYYMAHDFDLIIKGGDHLNVPLGTYRTTVTLTFYTNAGLLIATTTIPISFEVKFTNSCSGMAVTATSDVNYNFDTYAKLLSGNTSVNALTVLYTPNGATCSGWSLKIRANGNFTNGSSIIPPDLVAIRFNRVSVGGPTAAAIGVSNNLVPLSTSDVSLINPSNAAFNNKSTTHTFDMVIQGGNYLLLANGGTYSCPVTLSLYNQAGQLVSSSNTTLSFRITYANSSNYSITLLNPDVSMVYNTTADYINGKAVTKIKGLKVVGLKGYQVMVKTLNPYLSSGSNTIPVDVVKLENTAPAGKTGITSFPINLSSTDQFIIKNTMSDNTQTTEYDLKYSISSGNALISSAASGSYTTQVVFAVLPL